MHDVSVVVCTHDASRRRYLSAVLASLERLPVPAREVIVVVDHNEPLYADLVRELPGVSVVQNSNERGLGGARNSGWQHATGAIVAFIDDDVVVTEGWLDGLLDAYDDNVAGVGGRIEPLWEAPRPAWFPGEFLWVVGCSYTGLPEERTPVRNMFGCNMSFRRTHLEALGGFRLGYGCDETELCIRLRQRWPEQRVVYTPEALIHHVVPASRTRFRYFSSRCFFEGGSKAVVAALVGRDGLASETRYTRVTLPRGVARGLADVATRRRPGGLARSGAIVSGLATTAAGYAVGRLSLDRQARRRGWVHEGVRTAAGADP
jgi:GT2 family glycosyltransferase